MSVFNKDTDWVVYLIRNRHNALYCGVTNNLARRFELHQQGKGAKALKGKGPLSLVWSFNVDSKSQALKPNTRSNNSPNTAKKSWYHSS